MPYDLLEIECTKRKGDTWNANCTVQLLEGTRGVTSYIHLPYNGNKTGNWNVFINDDILAPGYNYSHWDIDIRGTIYQQVIGDAASAWTFEGYPL